MALPCRLQRTPNSPKSSTQNQREVLKLLVGSSLIERSMKYFSQHTRITFHCHSRDRDYGYSLQARKERLSKSEHFYSDDSREWVQGAREGLHRLPRASQHGRGRGPGSRIKGQKPRRDGEIQWVSLGLWSKVWLHATSVEPKCSVSHAKPFLQLIFRCNQAAARSEDACADMADMADKAQFQCVNSTHPGTKCNIEG